MDKRTMYLIDTESSIDTEDEYLEHFGILGMKWGHHKAKDPNVEKAKKAKKAKKQKIADSKEAYKQARYAEKYANQEAYNKYMKNTGHSMFVKNNVNSAYEQSKINKKNEKAYKSTVEKNRLNTLNKKAEYAKNKRGEKAEINVYAKEMAKYGKMGSITDVNSGDKATKTYEAVKAKKGKAYAEQVAKKANNKTNGQAIAAGALLVAAYAADIYFLTKDY